MKSSKYLIVVLAVGLAAIAVRAGLAPEGVSFLVNTVTDGSQREPSVAFGSDGSALIAWDTDAEGVPEIAGRLVAADGQPVGDEFFISPLRDTSQIRPVVAGLSGGGFVVAWESFEFESDEDELLVQRLDSDGDFIGGEIRIDETELHLHADVAATAGGGFAVVWDDGFDILGRRFDSSGQPIGGRFAVNAQQGTMYGPRIASDASGSFAVVWEDRSQIDGDGDGILLRRFNPQGAPLGGDIQVNSTIDGDQYGAAIGMRPDGAFVVVWEAYGQESLGDGAFGQVFDSSGARVGGEFRVDSGESVYAGFVAAAPTEDGFIVSWNEPRDEGGDLLNTFVRRFDLTAAAGQIIDVDPEEEGDQAQAQLATMGNSLMVVWEGFGPEDHDVFAQRFELLTEPSPCAGDCDGNGVVSIAELIRAVNIALGIADLSTCQAADRNGDGNVAINELIAAVNSALLGCV